MIQVPPNPGQMILDEIAMRMSPLLPMKKFVDHCKKRNIRITPERLRRFEELQIFNPVIRVRQLDGQTWTPRFDGGFSASEFPEGRVIDASAPNAKYKVPESGSDSSEAIYSQFQVMSLRSILQRLTARVPLEEGVREIDWNDRMQQFSDYAEKVVVGLRENQWRSAIPLLCQMISNRYLPRALSDQRMILVGPTTRWGTWIPFDSRFCDWSENQAVWDPSSLAESFSIDEKSLKHIHEHLVVEMRGFDPLWAWSDLRRFVTQRNRDQLKGDALCAECYRQSAAMIRLFYRDLTGAEFDPPAESRIWARSHIPDLPASVNRREHLRFIVNGFGLSPQPKAVLLMEGDSEVEFARQYYQSAYGTHHGNLGIDLVNLRGVGNATGNKHEDKFNAIFRLVDYLHQHQTLCFIMLDNEGGARELERASKHKPSIFRHRHRAIPEKHIRIWETNFEFDNFTDREIADGLGETAGETQFLPKEIGEVRKRCDGENLAQLYQRRTGRLLHKPSLAAQLANIHAHHKTSEQNQRPIADFLDMVARAAVKNPFPVASDIWAENQAYLGSSEYSPGK